MGKLKALYQALKTAPTLQGVTVVFGREDPHSQNRDLPMVLLEPVGGPVADSGYASNVNVETVLWGVTEQIDVEIWATAGDGSAVDEADAVEALRARVLQAFKYQAVDGVYFRPFNGNWKIGEDPRGQYRRMYVLSVQAEIPVDDVANIYADVKVAGLEAAVIIPHYPE